MSNEQNENKKERQPFAPGLCISKLVWVFLISCVVGFLVETLWCYIRHGYIESRQSLVYGPLSVAYGMGAVVLTMALYKFRNSPWWKIFLVSFVVGTVTEYICSLGQELVFGSVAWDYSNVPLAEYQWSSVPTVLYLLGYFRHCVDQADLPAYG